MLESAGVTLGMKEGKYDDLLTVNSTAPFERLLVLPTNPHGIVQTRAIEGAVAEVRDRGALLGIEDLERDVFLAIWQKIKEVYPAKVWSKYPDSRLLMNVSIVSLTAFILETMVAKQRMEDEPVDYSSIAVLGKVVERVVSRIPSEFWQTEWKLKELDTSSGRQSVQEALGVIDSNVRYGRPWYERVSLVDPAAVEESAPEAKRLHRTSAKKSAAKKVAAAKKIVRRSTNS
ncbi:hypothetical protein [Ramlibacter montanisoli]|uniref:Uncharacterized protein n=1 Tax=Ramlibacter montanisoli TaxID=2732512 RepID=A0A849KIX3_9BURK|nr:hypothetical protein [Ramlibacter montanisoli]NNU44785.1 hypothetical protein [Ramlibacter montanisoli]